MKYTHLFLVSSCFVLSCAQAQSGSVCGAGEKPFFECETSGGEVRLCASGGKTANESGLAFEWSGKNGNVFQFPRDRGGKKALFFSSETGYSGGGENRIRFEDDGKSYYLYDSVIQHEDDKGGRFPVAEAGLKIVEGDRLISTEKCLDSTKTIDPESKQHIPEEDFNYDLP